MRAITVFMLLVVPLPAFADVKVESPVDGTEAFRAGLECFREARYEEAAGLFERAYEGLPVVGDYILLYMSRALMETGDISGSLRHAGKILAEYPASPLRREARAIEAQLHAKDDMDRAVRLLESYAKDYPSDGEMRLLLGELLKKQGRPEKAEAVLKALYIEAGEWAEEAYRLMGEDIGLGREELRERAENLMENGSCQKAEGVLRKLLALDNYKPDNDIRKNLALSLYRQKKYSRAAPLFLQVDDLYLAAKSYLRAGNEDRFFKTLDAVITRKDEQGAELLVALAMELRRDGDFENALSVLENAMEHFPSLTEEALWSAGWTHYTSGDYRKAGEVFSRLHEEFGSNKYLYWKARAIEKAGGDASAIYKMLEGSDYYAFLAAARAGGKLPAAEKGAVELRRMPMKRIDILIEVGLSEEAAEELSEMSRKDSRYSTLLNIAYKLAEMEKYRKALLLLDLLPDTMRPRELLYPLAYWPFVNEASSRYDIDPFLLLSLIREESRYDPEAVSSAGAIGLMQLMPLTARRTARSVKVEINGIESIHLVENNIALGTHYLSGLLREFKSVAAALAAYNAGERRVRKWLAKERYDAYDEFIEDIPYMETRNYVKRIVTTYFHYQLSRDAGFSGAPGIIGML